MEVVQNNTYCAKAIHLQIVRFSKVSWRVSPHSRSATDLLMPSLLCMTDWIWMFVVQIIHGQTQPFLTDLPFNIILKHEMDRSQEHPTKIQALFKMQFICFLLKVWATKGFTCKPCSRRPAFGTKSRLFCSAYSSTICRRVGSAGAWATVPPPHLLALGPWGTAAAAAAE